MVVKDKQISVIGLGYIGLPTAALLASSGYKVNGMDVNNDVVSIINEGKIHIVEPDLDKYVKSAVSSNMLQAFIEVQPADIYKICVPTPFNDTSEIPSPNIDYVKDAALNISVHVKKGDIIILESTSPVGTTEMIETTLKEIGIDTNEIFIAYCPERVLPGKIMKELVENARVIGGLNDKSTEAVSDFYKSFVKGEILMTKAGTAEMCKLTENSFRDVNLAFAQQVASMSESIGLNPFEVIELANKHPRVSILKPSCGVGGHCIAVDPYFLIETFKQDSALLQAARKVNNSRSEQVFEKIKNLALSVQKENNKKPKVLVLGLTYKTETNSIKNSPSILLIKKLLKRNIQVMVHDPILNKNDISLPVKFINDPMKIIYQANIIFIMLKSKIYLKIKINKNKVNNKKYLIDPFSVIQFEKIDLIKSVSIK